MKSSTWSRERRTILRLLQFRARAATTPSAGGSRPRHRHGKALDAGRVAIDLGKQRGDCSFFGTALANRELARCGLCRTAAKRAEDALPESGHELRAVASRLINAEERERKTISRELHDDLNQKFACLAFDSDSLRMMPFSSEDKIREQLVNLRTRTVELSQHVGQISHQVNPSILEDLGLTAHLMSCAIRLK